MHYESGQLRFSPSDLAQFAQSEFAAWMERWHVERKAGNPLAISPNGLPPGVSLPGIDVCEPDPASEELELIAARGMEHERAFLRQLLEDGHRVADCSDKASDAAASHEAMRNGADFIYQARLELDRFMGFADFLARQQGDSSLGGYHYEVWDTKLARTAKAAFIVQLCAYTEMLEPLQSRRPDRFQVVLGTNEQIGFVTDRFLYYFRSLKRRFLEFQDSFNPSAMPHPGYSASHGRWGSFVAAYLSACDHLSTVANITRSQIGKLEAAGVTTSGELAATELTHVPHLPGPILQRLKSQARLQGESRRVDRPLYETQPRDQNRARSGLALLPPASPMDVFFDIEGFPLHEGGLEYLLGAVHLEDHQPRFVDWWAHDESQEKASFEAFVDWVHGRWQTDPAMHVYHYASYEVSAMRNLMGKYATREREVDDLLRHEVFVDLFAVVRQGLIVGTPSYSLKDVEKLYLEPREGDVVTAGGSVVAYHHWLDSGESQDWRRSPILKKIRDYNEIDCISTWKLTEWLRGVQREAAVQYVPPTRLSEDENGTPVPDGDDQHASTQLASRLIRDIESGNITGAADRRVGRLLAWLLEFHWREAKAVFWRMFDRAEMGEQELIDEFDSLGGLRRTEEPPRQVKRSFVYQYQFDPEQDTKLAEGAKCIFSHDLTVRPTITALDTESGRVEIKLGPSVIEIPDGLSLIPNEYVSAKPIADAVYRYVEAWSRRDVLSRAVDDLLHRRSPRLLRHAGGPLIPEGADLLPAVVDVVGRMDGTVLCIQGPPGTGKTYTAARAIVKLLADGKRVAVTSNSHRAILNLLESVHDAATERGLEPLIAKVGGEADHVLIRQGAIRHVPRSVDAAALVAAGTLVMGGTAWLFSRPELQGTFDYLFVDEAGQSSLANVVGAGLAAANIVLVGDQMQLAQPVQGSHPGESGKSALAYLLGDHATIPPELGVFLNQTYRMHPSICGFISEAVYEGRLASHPSTCDQGIVADESLGHVVTRQAGIVFVPVQHEGNAQGSVEEVDVIERIAAELTGRPLVVAQGMSARRLSWDDLLFVAPFNVQVRALKERLGAHARVGSVDRFQGQEAQVVILSMCSSSLEDSPRGASFLLEPNRLNVAVSRAKSLAIVVGSPELAAARCRTDEEMHLANLFCWLVEYAAHQ